MRYSRRIQQIFTFVIAYLFAGTMAAAQTDVVPGDPVDELRRVLREPADRPDELKDREERLARSVASLRSVQDLVRALAISAWRDNDPVEDLSAVDAKARNILADRLVVALQEAMLRPATQIAALNIVADLGTDLRETSGTAQSRRGVMRRLAPEVARLTESGSAPVRIAAARALSGIDPPAEVAAFGFGNLIAANDAAVRRSGAAGIRNSIQQGLRLLPTSGGQGTQAVASNWLDLLRLCAALTPKAGMGISDPDVSVRRDSAEAFRSAAHALYDYLFKPRIPTAPIQDPLREKVQPPTDLGRRDDDEEQAAMVLLARAIADQTPAIDRMLSDSDASIRLLGRRVLEDLADGLRRLAGPGPAPDLPRKREGLPAPGSRDVRPTSFEVSAPMESQQPTPPRANEAIRRGLIEILPRLAAGVNDPNVDVRRATVAVLELMGTDAAPATPALIQAVGDRDRFVRWIAGRALGRFRPADESAITALAGLLRDPDLDVRQVGAVALERYGPQARSAIPALAQAVESGDPDARIAALRALQAMGPEGISAVPSVIIALSGNNYRVRQAAARSLGRFGPNAASAEPALRQALLDTDGEVRAAAGEALLSILQTDAGK